MPDAKKPTAPKTPKTQHEVEPKRLFLLGKVTDKTFNWRKISLKNGHSVQVSFPVRVAHVGTMQKNADGIYELSHTYLFVPVTAAEQQAICKLHGYIPLTRAVADQCLNDAKRSATYVPFQGQYPHMADFELFSALLESKGYGGNPQGWGYGAHKLWLLSRHPSKPDQGKGAVNYGFYGPPGSVRFGHPNLDAPTEIEQDLGGRHNDTHWDYSQLLQVMKELKDKDGKSLDLRAELLAGNPAVWDEASKPQAIDLP